MPTDDIHMTQINLQEAWLEFLRKYVAPLATRVFPGYYSNVGTQKQRAECSLLAWSCFYDTNYILRNQTFSCSTDFMHMQIYGDLCTHKYVYLLFWELHNFLTIFALLWFLNVDLPILRKRLILPYKIIFLL